MHRLVYSLAALVIGLSTFATAGIVAEDITLYHAFNGATAANFARGSDANAFQGRMAFAPGQRGLGVDVGENTSQTGFAARLPGHVTNEGGTVAFWVNPGWLAKTSDWVCLTRVGSEGGSGMQLLVRPDGTRGLFMTSSKQNGVWRWEYLETGPIAWNADAFNHVALRWGNGRKELVVNGVVGATTTALLNQSWGTDGYLALGQAKQAQTPMNAPGTYDELVVLKRPASDVEVAALLAGEHDPLLDSLRTVEAPPRHLRIQRLSFCDPSRIIFEDERATGTLTLASDFPAETEITITLTLRDYYLEALQTSSHTVRVGGGTTAELPFSWQPTKRGIFKTVVTWAKDTDNHAETHDGIVFGVVSRTMHDSGPKPESFFGNHFELRDMAFARKIGSKWVRLHDFANWQTCWCWVEAEEGRFRWGDDRVKPFVENGFTVLGSLHRTPSWASDTGRRQAVPRDWEQFRTYVYRTVRHYKPWIRHWEIWNEPHYGGFWGGSPEEYATLLSTAHDAAKKANPTAVILGMGGVSLFHWDWIDRVLAKTSFAPMDVFAIHGYVTGVRPVSEQDLAHQLKALDARMKSAGTSRPVWNTECGVRGEPFKADIQDASLPPLHLRDAVPNYCAGANALVRIAVSQRQAGIRRWMYYWTKRPPVDRALSHGSLMHPDGSPMPTALAYATCAFLLEDTDAVGTGIVADGASVALFRRPDTSTVAVLWAEKPTAVSVAEEAGQFTIIDIMSNVRASAGRKVTAEPEPVFLEFSHPVDATAFHATRP